MQLPGIEAVNDRRIARFMQRITDARALEGLQDFQRLVERYEQEHDVPAIEIAAAMARLLQGDEPLLLKRDAPRETASQRPEPNRPETRGSSPFVLWRVAVGRRHGIQVRNLVGAIANEGKLANSQIGSIELKGDHSLVELPADLPPATLDALRKARVGGQPLRIERFDGASAAPRTAARPRRTPAH